MANLARLFGIGNLHPRENFKATGTIGSANAEVIIDCDGCSSFAIDLRDTFNLTIELSGTIDGTNWVPIPVMPVNQAARSYAIAIVGSTLGAWEGKCSAFSKIRARCTAYTSGSAIVTLTASNALLDDTYRRIVPSIVTTTAAVNTATTLTLPSPGAGLRHYLAFLQVDRFAAAALTAAAAPVIVTTSNLPGTLAFTVAADALTQGSLSRAIELSPIAPIAASAQNSNTTVVAPAVAGVIWRMTAGYFVAP